VTEEWRDLPGFDRLYQVSNLGRIKRLPRPGTRDRRLDHVLILEPDYAGHYLRVWLRDGDHRRRRQRVDRLVISGFAGMPYEVHDVEYRNGNKRDCRLENLVRLNTRTVFGPTRSRRSSLIPAA
jgi:hypothetical protein